MALRDQPYIPLYIQDIMTDEKLNECCAATHGIYIKGIMCLMHKSEEYGKILLKQKFKQEESMSMNFALQVAKHLPYSVPEIEAAISELVSEGVCFFDGEYLCQKRMIKDNEISLLRSISGKKGGIKTQEIASTFAKAKNEANDQANSEYENEIENVVENKRTTNSFKKPKTKILDLIPKNWPQDEFLEKWSDFAEMRRLKKKPLTENAIKRAVGALVRHSGGIWDVAAKIAVRSTDKAWDEFFPLPNDQIVKHDGKHEFNRDKA